MLVAQTMFNSHHIKQARPVLLAGQDDQIVMSRATSGKLKDIVFVF